MRIRNHLVSQFFPEAGVNDALAGKAHWLGQSLRVNPRHNSWGCER
jgi:hypothetical protein